ncbi:endonuclease domain-containing protein [Parasphingorhabdus sp.]|uniref:endonuclease domain-containing protein n=1 Tax=Parasphingorhabdus sp. TaxID=2709688 RepID=UPI003C76B63A
MERWRAEGVTEGRLARTTRKAVLKARQLRKTMSKPEVMLWQLLRKKPLGIKFRRQHPIGPYIVDFYCASAKLAIEVDGMAQDMGDRPERDERRERDLSVRGVETIRISAREVLHDPVDIADRISRYIQSLR